VVAVYENDFPYSIEPLLKLAPSSDVTVCAIWSLFVHITVVPTLTVVVAGKAIPAMAILFALLLLFPPAAVGLVLDFEQERKENDTAHAIRIAKYFVFMM
jgi:hypothetical protein